MYNWIAIAKRMIKTAKMMVRKVPQAVKKCSKSEVRTKTTRKHKLTTIS